ncbi:MAG: carbon monoxide dehydrogenase subunit [Chloroflexi bacterium]|nr:carbon monoxide dehydrogenase subunit [Chloroflexota bacterium]
MKLEHKATIAAPIGQVWAFLMDVPAVAKCAPGVESVEPLGDDKYRGTIKVSVGPIRLAFQGDVSIVERDEVAHTASMRADAADKRAGGAVKAVLTMSLSEVSTDPPVTELRMETDAQIMGRVGEFGQPIIRKKADQMVGEFGQNLSKAIAAGIAK